jgi:hypothetical protein
MLAGLVRVRSCVEGELGGSSAVRLSEEEVHGLLACMRGGDISVGDVVLAEKVTFLLASGFVNEVDCLLDDSVDLGSFLLRTCV